jgi:hypothetical protein
MLARVQAQTTSASSGNVVTFHDIARSNASAEPAPSLREITAELSGTVTGEMPNISVQFLLTLVMERVTQTLGTETGEHLSSFKARAILGLLSAPPQANVGGRLLDSDWIFFTIPSS